MGTQELTAPTPHAVLNVVKTTQHHYAKKRLTLPPPARCAPAVTQPITKVALSTRSSKIAAVTHSPHSNSHRNPIKSSLLNALLHQPAHHLPIFNQTRAPDPMPM